MGLLSNALQRLGRTARMGAGGAALGAGVGGLASGGDPEAMMNGAMIGGVGGATLGGMGQLARIGLGDVGPQAARGAAQGIGSRGNMAAAYEVIMARRMEAQQVRNMGYPEQAARLEQEADALEQRLAGML